MKLRILSARSKIDESVDVLADLDALVDEPVYFKLAGKTFKIKPVKTEQAFIAYQQFARLDALMKKKEISMTEAINVYGDLFESVIEKFDRKIVKDMTQSQCGALLKLIFDSVSGVAQADAKKKSEDGPEPELGGFQIQASILIGEVCRFYGWTFMDVWEMPARRFFSMHRAMLKLHALEKIEEVDIAVCGNEGYTHKYIEAVKENFQNKLYALDRKDDPTQNNRKTRELSEEEIKRNTSEVMKIFALKKQMGG